MEETNKTIDYYNNNATQYFSNTVNVDMSECCERFLKYVVPGGRIIDIGAGSGRDIKYFKDRGYAVEGIDASEEMCRLAADYSGAEVICERIQEWNPQEKYDGIWANASLLHLLLLEIEEFICRISRCDYLNPGGVLYISMKQGIKTGYDNRGRFFTDFSENIIREIILKCKTLEILDIWNTEDGLGRNDAKWLNVIIRKYRKDQRNDILKETVKDSQKARLFKY